MLDLTAHVRQIREHIPPHVRLVAVTKTVPIDLMRLAYAAGIRDFGESRVQEAAAKREQLKDLTDVTWHLIGHLQKNKARKALELFDQIHSIDSLDLAVRLNEIAQEMQRQPIVFLQVKLRPDPNKSGWLVPELWAALPLLSRLVHLNIQGLMTIPPLGLSPAEIQAVFTEAQALATQIRAQQLPHLPMHQLSMGMSADYPQAIAAGATIVRLGRVLFNPPDHPET